jgi:flagellar basal body-associated protein FliL
MSSLSNQSQNQSNHGIHWPAIVATLLVQILVVLALSVAAAFYLEWSSDANQAEFASATKPSSLSDSNHLPEVSIPVRPVIGRAGCFPKAQRTGP